MVVPDTQFFVSMFFSNTDLRGHTLSATVYLKQGTTVTVTPYAASGSSYVVAMGNAWSLNAQGPFQTVSFQFDTTVGTSSTFDPSQVAELGFLFQSSAGVTINMDNISF